MGKLVHALCPILLICFNAYLKTKAEQTCDLAIQNRVDCGYYGIKQAGCEALGCCWQPCQDEPGCTQETPWCFYSQDILDQCLVESSLREECGHDAITLEQCITKGCCWSPTYQSNLVIDEPWCFQPRTPNCKKTILGREYNGTASVTGEGLPCQRWDSQHPHEHTRNNIRKFPDATLSDAANYCRNPDDAPSGPWCYTLDPDIRWRYCDVPKCGGLKTTTTCKDTVLGYEYVGTLSETKEGLTCQRWDSQYPHEHSRNDPYAFPDASLQEAANYCRNPDGESGGPWCYTTDPDTRWKYCDIPRCKAPVPQCKKTILGNEYNGDVSVTKEDLPCQRWDSQQPHEHSRNNVQTFPDSTLSEAANHCRNPDNEPYGPWCYTTDPAVRWKYCDIPKCPGFNTTKSCKRDVLGQEYAGTVSKTKQGKTCQRWDSQYPHEHSRNIPSAFPDASLQEANNYCRNPDKEPEGPWCYTTDHATRWQYCDIPTCKGSDLSECKETELGREYSGELAVTQKGLECQRWDSQYPHKHSRNNIRDFPDASLAEASNFCRNPDSEPEGPWCYTTSTDTRWQYCDVPKCHCA